jgi:hypothetical protein
MLITVVFCEVDFFLGSLDPILLDMFERTCVSPNVLMFGTAVQRKAFGFSESQVVLLMVDRQGFEPC